MTDPWDDPTKLRFSSYHLRYDPAIHQAAYGARLIWREVMAGGGGVVWDRQDAVGERDRLNGSLQPIMDALMAAAREHWSPYDGSKEDEVRVEWPPLTAVASPQGSAGYLYVTVTLDRREPPVWVHDIGPYDVKAVQSGKASAPWLDVIWGAQHPAEQAGLHPIFTSDKAIGRDDPDPAITFEQHSMTADGRVGYAEVYSIAGRVTCRVFIHDDRSTTFEVYDPAYVPVMEEAVAHPGR